MNKTHQFLPRSTLLGKWQPPLQRPKRAIRTVVEHDLRLLRLLLIHLQDILQSNRQLRYPAAPDAEPNSSALPLRAIEKFGEDADVLVWSHEDSFEVVAGCYDGFCVCFQVLVHHFWVKALGYHQWVVRWETTAGGLELEKL